MRIFALTAALLVPFAVAQQVQVTFEQHPSNEIENRHGVLTDPAVPDTPAILPLAWRSPRICTRR